MANKGKAGTDLQRCITKAERRQSTSGQRPHAALTRGGLSIDEIVLENGSELIASLSDTAAPHDLSVMDDTRRDGNHCVGSYRLRGLQFLPKGERASGGPALKTCQLAYYGRLGGSVYTPKNELSIRGTGWVYPSQSRAP